MPELLAAVKLDAEYSFLKKIIVLSSQSTLNFIKVDFSRSRERFVDTSITVLYLQR